MRSYAQHVARRIERRVWRALAGGRSGEAEVEPWPSRHGPTEHLEPRESLPESEQGEACMAELHLTPLPAAARQGGHEPTAHVITRFPCVLGRASACDRCIDDLMVSRRHCVFTLHQGRVWVEDLASRNGTRLNGLPLDGARPVEDGDALQVAHLAFQVRLREAAVEPDLVVVRGERADSQPPVGAENPRRQAAGSFHRPAAFEGQRGRPVR
jgi:hypothetical protein